MTDPSSPIPISLAEVNCRRCDQTRVGLITIRLGVVEPTSEVEVEADESREKEKASPREERARKVVPDETSLTILGLAETCHTLSSQLHIFTNLGTARH